MNLLREDNSIITAPKALSAGRREWTDVQRQEWIDGHRAVRQDAPALSLGEHGLIQDCNKSLLMLFGFRRSDLVWQPVSKLFPQLADVELIEGGQVNPFLNFLCRCGQLYQSRNRQGDTFSSNLSIVRLEYKGRRSFRMIVRPSVS
ncbi:MAG: hypothetical protein Q7U94_08660 [Sideroxyarcus sp.]|nr:hypothetical protein [Sideroxyarcus sp.]